VTADVIAHAARTPASGFARTVSRVGEKAVRTTRARCYVGLVAVGIQEQAEDILVLPLLRNCLTLMTFPFLVFISRPKQWFYCLGHSEMSMMMMMIWCHLRLRHHHHHHHWKRDKQVCADPHPSALNKTLPAFDAERACQLSVDICSRRLRSAANQSHTAAAAVDRRDRQTDGRMDT